MVGHTHSITNILLEQNQPGRAASEAYVMTALRMQDGDELFDLVSRGRYLDVWSEDTGRWRIVRRTYVSDLVTTQPVVIRDLHEKLPRAAGCTRIAATRDRTDRYYRYYRYFAEAAVARLE